MINAKEIKIGDKFKSKITGIEYEMVENRVGDVLFLNAPSGKSYNGIHLFYDEIEDRCYAADVFNIKLE